MIKLKNPAAIYNKGNDQAIMLLHSFTGSVSDVKVLAERLHQEGFTTYVVSYPGHGLSVEEFLNYTFDDWWAEVVKSYRFLQSEGYTDISAAGVSLGGLFTLKLMEQFDITRGVAMSVPMFKENEGIKVRLQSYGTRINELLGLDVEESSRQLALIEQYNEGAEIFCKGIAEIMEHLSDISAPLFVMYGTEDESTYKESAEYIYSRLTCERYLQGQQQCRHLMTRGDGSQQVEEDIVAFFKQ